MYEQTLIETLPDYIKPQVIKKNNRYGKWEYGYNKEYDVVVISKTGKIGEIIKIQDLVIALPAEYDVSENKEKRWIAAEYPKELQRIKSVFDWKQYPAEFQEERYDYINKEFERREKGYWFVNKDKPTYITGTHYMYLQW